MNEPLSRAVPDLVLEAFGYRNGPFVAEARSVPSEVMPLMHREPGRFVRGTCFPRTRRNGIFPYIGHAEDFRSFVHCKLSALWVVQSPFDGVPCCHGFGEGFLPGDLHRKRVR
ncbi:MAG: hypothetical protein OXH09_05170 [Gammaproteobacteria bacterium]|nr:hypothetical protein [Gammaproteobacteria bacterium]